MSLILKGIDLPKCSNEDCVVVIRKDGNAEVWQTGFKERTIRAIQIPKGHGRLGDLDVLLEESLKEGAYNYVDSWQIAEQPTILEREE